MKTTIRIICILAVTSVICLAGAAVWAMPESQYFVQDNFLMTYGEVGNPLSAGTTVETYGSINRLIHWDVPQTAAYFSLSGVASNAGQINGAVTSMVFDTGSFTITSEANGGGIVLWTGTIQNLSVQSNLSALPYPASGYPRPSFESQPVDFEGVGSGVFIRTGGTWTDSKLILDWFGTYDTNYDAEHTMATGDLQGRLIVPEPGSIAGLLCGLVGITGFLGVRRRN